ncbi:MAG: hypothetical protein LQ349_003092 [Xanthoria aureola]|nr:MAG: hypothetical protein LQ349_003092 [Xanthoria aureola]
MAFSNTRPLSAFPARATSAQNQVTVDEFKNILTSAYNYAAPSSRSKQYKRVKVLLTYWTEDDLGVKHEVGRLRDTFERGYRYDCTVEQIPARGSEEPLPWMTRKLLELMEDTSSNDLLIFYYAGHGRSARAPEEGPCVFLSGERIAGQSSGKSFVTQANLDFAAAKKPTLDTASADVLYLLDCCHASTAAIKPGKELIAASAVETTTFGPRPRYSFTAALVQDLNQAVSAKNFLTAAQLYFKLLVHKPQLDVTPAHAEAITRQQPRTSIFLAPLRNNFIVPYPLIAGDRNLLRPGRQRSDIRAKLFVRVRNGDHHPHTLLEHLRKWLPTDRRGDFEEIDVSFDHATASTSITIVVFTLSIPTFYCLQSHPAVSFMAYVRSSGVDGNPPPIGMYNSRCLDEESRSRDCSEEWTLL